MHLLVVRHGQPLDESDTGGEGDPPLSELGLAQAAAIGEFLQHEGVDYIVSSPMVRARQTGEPLATILGLEMEFDDDLKEAGWQLGPYKRTEENLHDYARQIEEDPEHFYRPEGRAVFTERIMRSFTRIATEHPGETVAVFCHGMVTTTLASTALTVETPPDQFHPDYASLTRVRASPPRGLWSLVSFNESMHLQNVGLF